jgi:hypothetical protein
VYAVVEVHQEIAGLLRHPRAGGVGGDAGQMHPPALHLDDEQNVETGQADGLHGEEVTRQQPTSLRREELSPRRAAPARCRAEPVVAQDPANGGCRHADPRARHSPTIRM